MLNRKEVHNSETLNIQIDSHNQKSYLIELSKDCTKFDLNVECLENSFSKFFILNHAESACELNINMVLGSLTLAHSRNSQMSFMYGFFFVKFLFFTVVCVVIVI